MKIESPRAFPMPTRAVAGLLAPAHYGIEPGPCNDDQCGDDHCNAFRSQARERCAWPNCGKVLGYDREFRENPDGVGFVHASCLVKEFKKKVVRCVVTKTREIKQRWNRLTLDCGHEEWIRQTQYSDQPARGWKPEIPKRRECTTCKWAARDGFGNKRLPKINNPKPKSESEYLTQDEAGKVFRAMTRGSKSIKSY